MTTKEKPCQRCSKPAEFTVRASGRIMHHACALCVGFMTISALTEFYKVTVMVLMGPCATTGCKNQIPVNLGEDQCDPCWNDINNPHPMS